MPKVNEPISGQKYPGVVCAFCGVAHRLETAPERLAPEFDLTCPTCGGTKTYRTADIQILTAHTKH